MSVYGPKGLILSSLDMKTMLLSFGFASFASELKIHFIAVCCRCWFNSEGGEHHSRELVHRGSGAGRTSSVPGLVSNTATHTNAN